MTEQQMKDVVSAWYDAHSPEEIAAHFEAQKKSWVAAEMAFGDEGTRVVRL